MFCPSLLLCLNFPCDCLSVSPWMCKATCLNLDIVENFVWQGSNILIHGFEANILGYTLEQVRSSGTQDNSRNRRQ